MVEMVLAKRRVKICLAMRNTVGQAKPEHKTDRLYFNRSGTEGQHLMSIRLQSDFADKNRIASSLTASSILRGSECIRSTKWGPQASGTVKKIKGLETTSYFTIENWK